MKIIDNSKQVAPEIEVGDILKILSKEDGSIRYRYIARYNGIYLAINFETGMAAVENSYFPNILKTYQTDHYEITKVIKTITLGE